MKVISNIIKFLRSKHSVQKKSDLNLRPLFLGWNSKGNYFLTITRENFDTLNVWDVWSNKMARSILMKGHDLIGATFSDVLNRVALLRSDNIIYFYDVCYDLKAVGHLNLNMALTGISYSPRGDKLILVSDHNLYVYDLKLNCCKFIFHNNSTIHSDLLMPTDDGVFLIEDKKMIFCSYDGTKEDHTYLPDDILHSCLDIYDGIVLFTYLGSPECLYTYEISSKKISFLAKCTKPIAGMVKHPQLPIIGLSYDIKKNYSSIFTFQYNEFIHSLKKAS